jgi:ribosomal protein L15E
MVLLAGGCQYRALEEVVVRVRVRVCGSQFPRSVTEQRCGRKGINEMSKVLEKRKIKAIPASEVYISLRK